MKAICPKNEEHKKFTTTAHVMQDWEVDENGNYLNTVTECVQTTHSPHVDNIWTCSICGAEAIVK